MLLKYDQIIRCILSDGEHVCAIQVNRLLGRCQNAYGYISD